MKFSPFNIKNRIVPIAALVLTTAMTFPALADNLIKYRITDGKQIDDVWLAQTNAQAAVENSEFDADKYYIAFVNETDEDYAMVTLREKFNVTVNDNGNTKTIYTGAATAEQIAEQAGIILDSDDETEPSRDTLIGTDTDIEVIRVEKNTEYEAESVNYKKIYKKTKKLEIGQSKVKREGKKGVAIKSYECIYRNGKLSERNFLDKQTVKQPVNKVILKGTAQPTVQTSDGKLAYSEKISVEATAYSGGGLTASGSAVGVGKIAVDPRVIPLGTRMYITSADGSSWIYGTAVAADTGGAIKGNRIDLYFNSESECQSFGRRSALVYILS